uniref:PLAT domain-containing protein n=1 Tax=Heterorhabditis bacteriophora TaxID=37862 RepID=A0A1I7WF41_HETBA
MNFSLGRLSSIHGSGGFFLRFIRLNETHTTIETPSGQRTQLMTSIYDGSIETIQTGAAGVDFSVKFFSTSIFRNRALFATFSSRDSEVLYEGLLYSMFFFQFVHYFFIYIFNVITLYCSVIENGNYRSALRWGKRTTEAIYDRQNRVMERTIEGGGSVKFSYSKDIRFPVTVELADGVKYSIKVGDNIWYPFTMKPFLLAEDLDSNMVEWATADGLHHVNILRDVFGSITKVCELPTLFSRSYYFNIYISLLGMIWSVYHLYICNFYGLFLYDDRSGLLSSISGYQIFRESEQIRVQGHKIFQLYTIFRQLYSGVFLNCDNDITSKIQMTYEATFDAHRCITARKIIAGDIRLSLETTREKAGRVVISLWRTPNGEYKETTSFDAFGRLATFQRNDRRLVNVFVKYIYYIFPYILIMYIISESGIVKEVLRDPLGAVVSDSAPSFWIPLGYLGGIDLSQISIVILPGGRPFDTLLGRYLSFGPTHINQISFSNIAHSTDLFALEVEQNPLTIPHIPTGSVFIYIYIYILLDIDLNVFTDIYSWFRIIGISPAIFSSNYLNLLSSNTVLSRAFASFSSKLTALTQLLSISSSKLLDSTFTRMSPPSDITFTLEDIGFYEFLVLNSNEINVRCTIIPFIFQSDLYIMITTIDSLPILTRTEHELLTNIIGPAVEVDWCLFGTSWERHFVRSDPMPSSLTSSSHSHFTLITSRDTAELRNGKTKLFVHYGSNKVSIESVNKFLEDDLRRKDGPAVWRAEKKRWWLFSNSYSPVLFYAFLIISLRELLSKGVVPGYMLMFNNSVNARFPTIHLWHLVKQPN